MVYSYKKFFFPIAFLQHILVEHVDGANSIEILIMLAAWQQQFEKAYKFISDLVKKSASNPKTLDPRLGWKLES